jgi:5-formyltetrahydrofolate cyclo-ligase
MPDAISRQKRELRALMTTTRAAVSRATREAAAQKVADPLASVFDRAPCVISSYMPIGDEIDPEPLSAALRQRGHRIALPVMVGRDAPLEFRLWLPGDPLVARQWSILEPMADAEVVVPDILLVPLLAVDRNGYRLGYGGGYYDRTLALLRPTRKSLAIGLAFDLQVVDWVPHVDYDQKLDGVLTPSGLIGVT